MKDNTHDVGRGLRTCSKCGVSRRFEAFLSRFGPFFKAFEAFGGSWRRCK